MAIEIVSFPIQNGVIFHSYVAVYQRVSNHFHEFPHIFSPRSTGFTVLNQAIALNRAKAPEKSSIFFYA